ncbi:MAG: hypothetical protein QF440_03870 [Candidatus Thalassarchaeaceae archaeon]|nr:hypothetical protein [Candidatus Thalassarchaeaceae archaeon]
MGSKLNLPLLMAALMFTGLIPMSTANYAPTNGGPYAVDSDETWDQGGYLDAQVVIEAGATLTITSNIIVKDGASITVNEGATLNVSEGGLSAENGPHAVRPISISDSSSLLVDSSVSTAGFALRIISAADNSLEGWTVSWDDITPQDMNGTMHEINFTAPKEDFRIYFDLPPGNLGDLVIDRLEVFDISTSATHITYATDAAPIDCFLAGDVGFPLIVNGNAHFENSLIEGSEITITGDVTTDSSAFKSSGPVVVTGGDASLIMSEGSISLSRMDHDVQLDSVAQIIWGAANGTGGLIDRWERIVPEQIIHIPIDNFAAGCPSGGCVQYDYHGLGSPNAGNTGIRAPDIDGNAIVPSRTVEIGWADSTDVWNENGFIEIKKFQIVWNLDSSIGSWSEGEMVPMPYDVGVFNILEHLEYPVISVDSVELESDVGTIGESMDVVVTVSNTGTAAAAVAILCNIAETGQSADMTPLYSSMTLERGETDSIEALWSYGGSGDASLVCFVNEPAQLLDTSAFITNQNQTGTYGDSTTVDWSSSDETEFDSLLIVITLIIVVIVCLVAVVRMAQQGAFDDITSDGDGDEGEDEISDGNDDEGDGESRVDRFKELLQGEED